MSDRESGVVKWFNRNKGYGFIVRDNGNEDVFVHYKEIKANGYRSLVEGERVTYTLVTGDKGLQASEVIAAEEQVSS